MERRSGTPSSRACACILSHVCNRLRSFFEMVFVPFLSMVGEMRSEVCLPSGFGGP